MHNSLAMKKVPMQHSTHRFEVKTASVEGVIAGYASVFNVVDRQRDAVLKGAFLESLKKPLSDIKLLWQHQWQEPIGVIEQLFEDANGLYMQARLQLDVARAREALSLVQSGAVNGLSIGYQPISHQVDADTGVRKLKQVDLFEISLVTLPANPQARISVSKSAYDDGARQSKPDWEMGDSPEAIGALLHALSRAEMALGV